MKFRVKYLFILTALFVVGCFNLEDIESITSPTDVEERFEDSINGDTKQLNLPESKDNKFDFIWVTDMHFLAGKSNYMKDIGIYADEVGAKFVLHSGDLAEHGEDEEYEYVNAEVQKYLSYYMIDFFSAIGNHDLSGDGWDAFRDYIGPSVFIFNYGNTMFIFTDTANATVGAKQMEWIEEQLDESNKENKIMLSHFPFYDGILETPTIMGDPDERYKLMYLCEEYDVDYVLTGHKHSIEEHEIGGTTYICGGMASGQKDPINGDDLLYHFKINGSDIDFEKVYFDDLD